MAKSRYYRLIYWNRACTKIDTEMAFDSKNEAIRWLIDNECNPLTVNYIGWR